MTDYESPIQTGKPIVIGQAAILWSDSFMHPDKGYISGGWILPGCVRTANGEYASSVCRRLNETIKASQRDNPIVKPAITAESMGEEIARRLKEVS